MVGVEGVKIMIQISIERRKEAIPEGYVKVVRCGECKYFKKIGQSWLGPGVYCGSCERLCDEFESYSIPMNENDFCSRGERKEETKC